MKIEPLRRFRHRPIALVFPGWHTLIVVTVDGEKKIEGTRACYETLKALGGHQVYASGSLKGLVYSTGSSCWQAEVWRGRATSMSLDGTTTRVSSLRRTLDTAKTPSEMFSNLLEGITWLENQGVSAGSLSSMSWNLWRSTLEGGLELAFDAKVGRSAFYGGRQESSQAKSYQGYVSLDIASAYPHSMAARPYAATMREVAASTILNPEVSGLARAKVTVPTDLPYPPLPVRVGPEAIQFQRGIIHGTWAWGELAAAKTLGCSVDVERCWAPNREVDPFKKWFEVVRLGREEISPGGVKLVKAVSNSLWGMFGMTGNDRGLVRWHDNGGQLPELVSRLPKKMPQANTAHLAAETTSRVRVRMLLEGLYSDYTYPIHVDTDGVIVRKSSLPRRNLGTGPGSWQVKQSMPRVEIRGPQLYRYRCGPGCGTVHNDWHYVASGMTTEGAARFFDKVGGPIEVSVGGIDTVLASGHALDFERIMQLKREASIVETMAFGQPLVSL